MPRYRSMPDHADAAVRERLVNILANELRTEPSRGPLRYPFIYEEEVPQTDTFQVVVVWDEWQDIPPEERAPIILDAYQRGRPELVGSITVALGVTVEEVAEMNLFPFQVVPMIKKSDAVSPEQMKDAMLQEGAVTTTHGLQLRFPTQKMAEESYARLASLVPGPYWAIQRNVSSNND